MNCLIDSLKKLLLLLTLSIPVLTFSQSDIENKIASIVEEHVNEYDFSGTILIAQQGKSFFHQSYGLADLSTEEHIQNHYHYSIASITKLFTAIRILQLAETDQLDLNRSVIDYLPEMLGQIAAEITTHHLLVHISGLPKEKDYFYLTSKEPASMVKKALALKPKSTLNSFRYNNTDYFLLGMLIERLSGQSWEKEIQDHILRPLNMENTGFLAKGQYPTDFAYPYRYHGKKRKHDRSFHIENFHAAGCMYSTSSDLLRLDQALYTRQLLTEKSYALLATSYPEYGYAGYGVWNYQYPFVASQPTIMERRGGILGANVVLVRLTDSNHTIIILSNNDRFNPDSFGDPTNLREKLIRVCSEGAKS